MYAHIVSVESQAKRNQQVVKIIVVLNRIKTRVREPKLNVNITQAENNTQLNFHTIPIGFVRENLPSSRYVLKLKRAKVVIRFSSCASITEYAMFRVG